LAKLHEANDEANDGVEHEPGRNTVVLNVAGPCASNDALV